MKKKRVVAIGRHNPTFDELIVDPAFCPHLNVVNVMPSNPISPQDADEPFANCLDCGAVMDGNRQWVMPADDNDIIPF